MRNTDFNLIANVEKPTDIYESLPDKSEPLKYPVDALGDILGGAAKRLAYHVHVPEGMAAQSVLAVASLVAQAHVNVCIPSIIGVKPVSLFFLTVAESGDRKSSVDNLALSVIHDFESQRLQNFPAETRRYDVAMETWKLRRDSIIKSIQNKGSLTAQEQKELEEELFNLEESKPKYPARPNILFSEPTPEGIFRHYQQGLPSAGLFNDEGISFFSGHGMKEDAKGRMIGMLSHFWDGKPITRTRGALAESSVLSGCRLTTHLMLQPIIAEKIYTDPIMQGQGIMARFLIFDSPSIAGSRFLKDRDLTNGVYGDPIIMRYWATVKDLLERKIKCNQKTGELVLESMEICGEALRAWSMIHDTIEEKIASGGNFEVIKPFASKGAENVARIAAVLAFVEGSLLPNASHIKRGGEIVSYYLQSMANRSKEAIYDKDDVQARDLFDWIKKKGGLLRCDDFNSISPTSLRSANKARKLLRILEEKGYLTVVKCNSRTGKPSIWEIHHPQQSASSLQSRN